MPEADTGDQWYCVRSEFRQEYKAFAGLSSAGFSPFFPRMISRTKGNAPRIVPYFSRYLFARFDTGRDRWRDIFTMPGVDYLFCSEPEKPTPVPADQVERIMALGRAGDGVIDDRAPAFPRLEPGSAIRVTSGAFADWRGVLRWSDEQRVRVLLELMGGPREVTMPRASVAGA